MFRQTMHHNLQKQLHIGAKGFAGSRQQGIVLILTTIGMIAILGMAGLALDMGRTYLNKTSLQNALDAAALSGAKTLNAGEGVSEASSDARETFRNYLQGDLSNVDVDDVAKLVIDFADTLTLNSFTLTSSDPTFIRVRVSNEDVPVGLTSVLGITDLSVGGSAVAGPIPLSLETCNLTPICACGEEVTVDPDTGEELDTPIVDENCEDDSNGDGNIDCYGLELGIEITLKDGSDPQDKWEVGTGNFQLLNFDNPASDIAEQLAGGFGGCASPDETLPPYPGNKVGLASGINTRFGDYQNFPNKYIEADYPPDIIVAEIVHDQYDYEAWSGETMENGVAGRRILTVPLCLCKGDISGASGTLKILNFGCFFLTKPAGRTGPTSKIYGQFIEECPAEGTVLDDPDSGPATNLYKIVLYKAPNSVDS